MAEPVSEPDRRPRRILLGVGGGIAAYKTPELVRRLRERGAEVQVVTTRAAEQFVAPLSLQAVSGRRVRRELFDAEAEAGMGHIELARWADELLIAPATADLIARLAEGRADDLLTTLALATTARLWLAPAMNRQMWVHPAVQANWSRLIERGARALGPGVGDQACGEVGPGRMLEPEAIVDRLWAVEGAPLRGRSFIVTAGPTHEPLDPVRFVGNRSSGRMGFAVARALQEAGAEVTLVAGPVQLTTPPGVRRIDVQTALQMREAVHDCLPADGFVAVAAVADYRPSGTSPQKIKRDGSDLTLTLVPNPDIVAEVAAASPRPFVVGFAAETEALEDHARAKLRAKGLDLIAANLVGDGRGFESEDNELIVLAAGQRWALGRASKLELARRLVSIIAERMG